MNISEIYNQKRNHLKKVKFLDGEIEVKLLMQDEANEYAKMVEDPLRWDEFLSKVIFEDGKSLFEHGKISIFKHVPSAHKQELMKLFTNANGGSSSFEEKKSD
jgi:hypothetical protein